MAKKEFPDLPDEWPETGRLDLGNGEFQDVELLEVEQRLTRNQLDNLIVDFGGDIGSLRPWRHFSKGVTQVSKDKDGTTIIVF